MPSKEGYTLANLREHCIKTMQFSRVDSNSYKEHELMLSIIDENIKLKYKEKILIEILEENNKKDKHTVQVYENMYRNVTDEFYKKSYKRTIDMANARRETRKGILEFINSK